MSEREQSPAGGPSTGIVLTELSVVIAAEQNNPSILNPDFLTRNKIVAQNLGVQEGSTISTPMFSRVAFVNDVSVTAEPSRIIFAQTGQPLEDEDASQIPDMAVRFLKTLPHVPYRAIGINPKGIVPLAGSNSGTVANALKDSGVWTTYKGILPEMTLTGLYRCPSRTIQMNVSSHESGQNDDAASNHLQFQANFHHDIGEGVRQGQIEKILSVLTDWKADLDAFRELVTKFVSQIAE